MHFSRPGIFVQRKICYNDRPNIAYHLKVVYTQASPRKQFAVAWNGRKLKNVFAGFQVIAQCDSRLYPPS